MTDEVSKWRRRERAAGFGMVLWAMAVSVVAVFDPQLLAQTVTTTDPMVLAGGIMISSGLCGAFLNTVFVAIDQYSKPENTELTEWSEQ